MESIRKDNFKSGTNLEMSALAVKALAEDCVTYGFIKSGKANLNGFLNVLIPNLSSYFEFKYNEFSKFFKGNKEKALEAFKASLFSSYKSLCDLAGEKRSILVNLRINKGSLTVFIEVHDRLLSKYNMGFNEYIKNLLAYYVLLPLPYRELCFSYKITRDIKKAINKRSLIKIYSHDEFLVEGIPVTIESENTLSLNSSLMVKGVDEKDNNFGIPIFKITYIATVKEKADILKDIDSIVSQNDLSLKGGK